VWSFLAVSRSFIEPLARERKRDRLDGDTRQVSIKVMTDVTSKVLHEKTGQLLDRARQGERFRILRDGRTDAFLIPATEAVDPSWLEIMDDVWKAQKSARPKRRNPVLKERKARNYAARLR
jgi:antitoxin (DNA-binding transcriptional repressor) of toxin-antitoxin stability system